ncbi:glycosyltransferase family 4 protein [Trichloromonas sp.]|uniref:glycosyltransferase family 4 protein n=1 Tax=Trichloromonas sp. TaxID=3069249 RepID=UPI002A3FCC55|nr:glycosyltransferase family 4 protein [Trichloromonas sp.]
MNFLHISALPVWSMDGKGGMPSLRETLKGHLAAGHHIELVLPQYDPFSDDEQPLFVPEGQKLVLHFAPCRWLLTLKKLRIKARGKGDAVPFAFRWILNVGMLLGLTVSLMAKSFQVRRNGFVPQLVYAHNQYAALAGFLLGRWFKVPNVTRLYGTFLADLMNRPFVGLRYPTAAAGYLVPSSLLICANDGTRGDEVARKFGTPDHRFRFWQNGVEPPSQPPQVTRADLVARFGPQLRLESRWAVSCSRLSYWKRIDRMLRALAVCRGTGVDCQLVVAGDGPEKENLRTLATELGVSDQVVWLGAVAHDDIWALMNTADMFMITNDVTNRCNPLYEAAWAGLPVLSVNDPSTSDLLHHRENALLAEKDDKEALGKLLAEICRDEPLRERLGQAQKQLSETFWTWEERMRVEVAELEKLVPGVDVMTGGR